MEEESGYGKEMERGGKGEGEAKSRLLRKEKGRAKDEGERRKTKKNERLRGTKSWRGSVADLTSSGGRTQKSDTFGI